jgi:hypothetical protein
MRFGRRRMVAVVALGGLTAAGRRDLRFVVGSVGGSFGSEGRGMVTIYPSLRVSANGAVALVDAVAQGYKVVSIPDLAVQFEGTYQNVVDLALSGFGAALGIRMTTDEVIVVRDGQQQRHALPRGRDRIRGFAVSDASDRLALALGGETYGEAGTLEVWSLPAGEAPLAAAALPAIGRGFVASNPSFSRISLVATTTGGELDFRAVYAMAGGSSGALKPIWIEQGAPLQGTAVSLSDEWSWIARGDGLAGWRGDETEPMSLPGTAFERLIYSPTGSHLLAARVERLAGPTSAEVLFRLLDLSTLTEVARATHVIENDAGAHPVVAPDLSLLILRATRSAEVEMREYELTRSG